MKCLTHKAAFFIGAANSVFSKGKSSVHRIHFFPYRAILFRRLHKKATVIQFGVQCLEKMKWFLLLSLLAFEAADSMFVESYWESWVLKDYGPDDFCSFLKDVPATPVGSVNGVNYVDIGEWIRVFKGVRWKLD